MFLDQRPCVPFPSRECHDQWCHRLHSLLRFSHQPLPAFLRRRPACLCASCVHCLSIRNRNPTPASPTCLSRFCSVSLYFHDTAGSHQSHPCPLSIGRVRPTHL